MKQPLVLELKGNSLDDGPGIRTAVFFNIKKQEFPTILYRWRDELLKNDKSPIKNGCS